MLTIAIGLLVVSTLGLLPAKPSEDRVWRACLLLDWRKK